MKITIEVMPNVLIKNAPPSNALIVNLNDPSQVRGVLKGVGLDVFELEGRVWLDISGFTGTISVSDQSSP